MSQVLIGSPPMRALIAARKSTKVKGGQEGASLHTQDQRAREFCERLGWPVVAVAADTISGRVAPIDRKELGAKLAHPEDFDVVVAYRTDRLSRGNQEDWTRIEHWATEHGKSLVMVDAGTGIRYPARDDSDYWQWTAEKRRAGREWEEIRERALRAQADLVAAGSYQTKPPLGYRIVGSYRARRLEVVEEHRALIEQTFALVIEGLSTQAVADRLGHPNAIFVARIVNNWTYAGRLERLGFHYADCPAIVDAGTLVRAQRAVQSRDRKSKGGRPPRRREAPLLIPRCGEHDRPMYRSGAVRLAPGEEPYGKPQYGIPKYRCNGHFTVPVALVDRAVWLRLTRSTDRQKTRKVIPGQDWTDEIERLKRDRRQALEREEIERVVALSAEIKELENRPVEPDRIEAVESDQTYGELFREMDREEMRLALKEWTVKIYPDGGIDVVSPLGWIEYEG